MRFILALIVGLVGLIYEAGPLVAQATEQKDHFTFVLPERAPVSCIRNAAIDGKFGAPVTYDLRFRVSALEIEEEVALNPELEFSQYHRSSCLIGRYRNGPIRGTGHRFLKSEFIQKEGRCTFSAKEVVTIVLRGKQLSVARQVRDLTVPDSNCSSIIS